MLPEHITLNLFEGVDYAMGAIVPHVDVNVRIYTIKSSRCRRQQGDG